jgi:hypothetical protein
MRRPLKILFASVGFGLAAATGIALATGSAQLGLHAAFWLGLVFTMWIEARIPE